jgi:hypothetical protein
MKKDRTINEYQVVFPNETRIRFFKLISERRECEYDEDERFLRPIPEELLSRLVSEALQGAGCEV